MFRVDGYWLNAGEQEECIAKLFEAGILVCDSSVNLPLKSGGKTDIYINARLMRNTPWAIRYLGELYGNALRRLRIQRILEVPEAVSPLAGHISALTDIPLVTVRESAKAGRVVSGTLIGDLKAGENVAVVDDVATDGESKIAALKEIRRAGANLVAIVALVDRQGGWKKHLEGAGFPDVPFWFGMTLHDVRKCLLNSGLMRRCDPEVEAKNPIIVALDGKDWADLIPLLIQLRSTGCILKVNDLLMDQGISNLIPNLSVYGRVMADLKCHDIPNTVANICKRLRKCPPWAVTVHASGAGDMIKKAKEALAGTPTKVLAVTVLTSLDEKTCEEVYHWKPLDQALALGKAAVAAGADGLVCSPKELPAFRPEFSSYELVIPGLRSPGKEVNDQARVDTPKNARELGANYLVMGRQILESKDPVAEVQRVIKEELGIEIK